MEKNCRACRYCYLDDGDFICGHKDSGIFGLNLSSRAAPYLEGQHCGPDRSKFEQHPLRQENGDLRG